MAKTKWRGIRRNGNQWEVRVMVRGDERTAYFPLDTPLDTMRDWRQSEKTKKPTTATAAAGSLAAKMHAYATRPEIQHKATAKQIMAHLEVWATALGRDRSPVSVTAAEITAIEWQWLKTPTCPDYTRGQRGRPSGPGGLAPDTVRKRRTTLMGFFAWVLGPDTVNPVTQSYRPPETKPEARALNYAVVTAALAWMPDYRSTTKGTPPRRSKSKIRARVMAYLGLPPSLIKQILPSHLNLKLQTLTVSARTKGGGVEVRELDLRGPALDAMRDFHASDCYGSFSGEALNQCFKRAAVKAGLAWSRVSVYWLRHSFGTQIERVFGDQATTARLMMHAPGSKMTARYTLAAHRDVNRNAVDAFIASLPRHQQAG